MYAQTPGNSLVGVTLSVLLAAATSFLVGSVILRASRRRDEEGDLAAATAQMEGLKGKESSISGVLTQLEAEEAQARTERVEPIRKIVFACDAGHGLVRHGGLGAAQQAQEGRVRGRLVVNVAIANLDDSYDLVVTHQDLTLRAGTGPQRPARLGHQLHGQPQIRRDRGRGQDHQRPQGAAPS